MRIWETELEFCWNGEVVERSERRRGDKGVFVNWRHVIGALSRKPGAMIEWRHKEAMFPNLRWRTLYDLLKGRHSPGRAEREYLGILSLGLEHRLEILEAAIQELADEVSLDLMRRRFSTPNNIVEMSFEVDLHCYDELLSSEPGSIASQEVAYAHG